MTIHHLAPARRRALRWAIDYEHDRTVRVVPVKTLDQIARENEGLPDLYECLGAIPSGRAAAASRRSLLRVSSIASIAIAAFCVVYFSLQFMRGAL
jgi:hypothetical protein